MHNHAGLNGNASLTCSSTVNFSKSNMRSSFTSQLVKHSNIHRVLVYRINASIYHEIKIRFFNSDTKYFSTELGTSVEKYACIRILSPNTLFSDIIDKAHSLETTFFRTFLFCEHGDKRSFGMFV